MHNMTDEELLDKIAYEGPEYFFLDYISLDCIADEDLQNSVQRLRLAWEEVMEVVDYLEDAYGVSLDD
jgi:uncharacterized radical SAM superfamily protein